MSEEVLFFPLLKRRGAYRTKRTGEYYASYHEYKQEIREDCLGRCVYCDCHENELDGSEQMNLDHFRPRKYKEHENLISNPHNLIWACAGCNRLKLDDWPALGLEETFVGDTGYLDPFVTKRCDYFAVESHGEIVPLQPPAAYIIIRLELNRLSRRNKRKERHDAHKLVENLTYRIDQLRSKDNLTHEE